MTTQERARASPPPKWLEDILNEVNNLAPDKLDKLPDRLRHYVTTDTEPRAAEILALIIKGVQDGRANGHFHIATKRDHQLKACFSRDALKLIIKAPDETKQGYLNIKSGRLNLEPLNEEQWLDRIMLAHLLDFIPN